MNAGLKAKWLAALRSGDYKQGHDWLRFRNRYCCLGVLCEVAEVPRDRHNNYAFASGKESQTTLRGQLMDEVGKANIDSCIEMNDGDKQMGIAPKSFSEIADWIEEHV